MRRAKSLFIKQNAPDSLQRAAEGPAGLWRVALGLARLATDLLLLDITHLPRFVKPAATCSGAGRVASMQSGQPLNVYRARPVPSVGHRGRSEACGGAQALGPEEAPLVGAPSFLKG